MKIINLGLHPLADSFLTSYKIKKEQKKPLECFMNSKIGKIYLKSKFSPFYRYNFVNYSYTSSNSTETTQHWKNFFNFLNKKFLLKNKKILEIGSNDGFLLSLIQSKTKKIVGIDASQYMVKKSKKKNINTIFGIFSSLFSKKIKKNFGNFDIIIANNVVNHSDNVLDFFKGIKNLMHKESYFIFEVPYWPFQLKKNLFDQIYHEHRTFFTVKYINYICERLNLKVVSLSKINFHGQSLRVIISKNNKKKINLKKYINFEKKLGVFKVKTYKKFMYKIKKKKEILLHKVNKILLKKGKIFAVGASAKGNTFLNYHGFNKKMIMAVTDISKEKINKFTPGTHIKILHDKEIKKYKEIYAIVLSWNIKNIKKNFIKYNNKVKFIW